MHVVANLPSPAQGVWHVGPLPVRAYALCTIARITAGITAGIVAALTPAGRRWANRPTDPPQVATTHAPSAFAVVGERRRGQGNPAP